MDYALGAIALVLALLGLHYARRQVPALRRLSSERAVLPRADYLYLRNQAWRRLVGCVLLWVMCGMLVTNIVTDLEGKTDRLAAAAAARQAAQPADAPKPPPAQADRDLARLWAGFWCVFLALLMVLVLLVAWEVWAIRRYAIRHLRQINADRREMIEHELAILRSQRNGQAHRSSNPHDLPET